jgi:hypothetical protein
MFELGISLWVVCEGLLIWFIIKMMHMHYKKKEYQIMIAEVFAFLGGSAGMLGVFSPILWA